MNDRFSKYFTETSFREKIGKFASTAGQQVIYAVLLLYYTMKDPGVEIKQKLIIGAALGYFILPADAIPDLTPVIGFSDDLGVLIFALTQIYASITPEIRKKARIQMNKWFGKVDERQILQLEEKVTGKPSTDNG